MSAVAARGVLNDDEIEIGDSPVFVNQRCGTTGAQPSGPSTSGRSQGRQREPSTTEEVEIIDLTSDNPYLGSPEIEIIASTVRPAPRAYKRARVSPTKQAFLAVQAAQQAAAAKALAQPQEPPSPKGPKCGICLEPMGNGTDRQMWAGGCGHVYCKDCLTEAIKATKKCPTCRKNLQVRQIHPVFVQF